MGVEGVDKRDVCADEWVVVVLNRTVSWLDGTRQLVGMRV